jgi:hypothetical protein
MKTIYSYYRSIVSSPQAEEFACANWWKRSWEKNGWNTCMLNSTHAQASSLYAKLMKKLISVSSYINPEKSKGYEYFNVRFSRWCALHAAGGGWMCDYDVANKNFTPDIADKLEQENTLYVNSSGEAYIFYATREHCESVIRKMIQDEIVADGKPIKEAKILGVTSDISSVLPMLHHAKPTKNKSKSEVMEKVCYG